jgi:hypothetical protein
MVDCLKDKGVEGKRAVAACDVDDIFKGTEVAERSGKRGILWVSL